MWDFFGKTKIRISELAPLYVDTIYDVVGKGFGEIAGYINEETEFTTSPNLSEAENEWFLYIVYAGNLVNNDAYFTDAKAEEVNRILSRYVIRKMGKDPDTSDQILYDYEKFLRDIYLQTQSVVKAMSLAIFHKYDLNKYQKEHFQKLNAPNPLVVKELNEMVQFFLWNWDDFFSKYKIII
jgi:hypothetical protein